MSEALRDAERDGAPPEVLARLEGDARESDGIEIWPEHLDAAIAFLTVQSQWRTAIGPTGRLHYFGLDYAGVSAGLVGAGIDATPELWAQLRIMEGAARSALNNMR